MRPPRPTVAAPGHGARGSNPQAGGGRFLPGFGCNVDPTDGTYDWSEQQRRGPAHDGYCGTSR